MREYLISNIFLSLESAEQDPKRINERKFILLKEFLVTS